MKKWKLELRLTKANQRIDDLNEQLIVAKSTIADLERQDYSYPNPSCVEMTIEHVKQWLAPTLEHRHEFTHFSSTHILCDEHAEGLLRIAEMWNRGAMQTLDELAGDDVPAYSRLARKLKRRYKHRTPRGQLCWKEICIDRADLFNVFREFAHFAEFVGALLLVVADGEKKGERE